METADQQNPARGWARGGVPSKTLPSAPEFPSKRELTQESCIHEAEVSGGTATGRNPHPKSRKGERGCFWPPVFPPGPSLSPRVGRQQHPDCLRMAPRSENCPLPKGHVSSV